MRRPLSCLLALGLAVSAAPLLEAAAAADPVAPGVPTGVEQFAAIGGAGLTWAPASGTVDGYHVLRDGVPVTDVSATSTALAVVDAGLASGASAGYTVVAFGPGGSSAATSSVSVTRPAADATAGSADAFVIEGINRHFFMDAARGGDGVTFTTGLLRGTAANVARATSSLPVVPGPGTYTTSATPTGAERSLDISLDGFDCSGFAGTLTVRQAAFDASLQPLTYAAEVEGTCTGYPVTASLRWHSDVPYVAVSVDPEPVAPQTDVAVPSSTPVTLTNHGLSPLSVGTSSLSGAHAAEYSVDSGTCTSSIPAAGSCQLSVGFTPTGNGPRAAQLDQVLGDLSQVRSVSLNGIGGHLPGRVTNVQLSYGYQRNLVTWDAPTDVGSPAPLSYHVYSSLGNYEYSPTFQTVTSPSLVDTGLSAVNGNRYKIVAVTAAGEGQPYETDGVANGKSAVLEVSAGPGGVPGLFQVPVTGLPSRRIPFLADGTPRFTPAVSPDGTQVVYAQATSTSPTAPLDLWVIASSGLGAPRHLTSLPGTEVEPSWSRDGTSIAFSYFTSTSAAVEVVPAAGGAPTLRAAGYEHPSWLADNSGLVADNADNEGLYRIDRAGHAVAITGAEDGYSAAVSPDGTLVAYTQDADTATRLAVVPVGGGTPAVLSDSVDWDTVSWGPDNRWIYGERYDSDDPHASRVGYGEGGFTLPNPLTPLDAPDASPVLLRSTVHLTSAPAVTNRSVSIPFAGAGGGVTCALDGTAPTSCTSPYTAASVAPGSHRLVITALATNGTTIPDSVTGLQWTVDATAPAVKVTAPTTNAVNLTTSVTFSYSATDASAGVQSYDVRYRRATSSATYGAYTSPTGWSATTATFRRLTVAPGYEYCFDVRARDKVGNVSAWTADRCVDVALDDPSFTASAGWTRGKASGFYRSTYTSTTKTGTSLSLRSVATRRITLVVTKCASCGQVGVYVGTTRVAVVDTRAAATARQVKVVVLLPSVRTGAFSLKPLQAGRTVQIDGVAFGRA